MTIHDTRKITVTRKNTLTTTTATAITITRTTTTAITKTIGITIRNYSDNEKDNGNDTDNDNDNDDDKSNDTETDTDKLTNDSDNDHRYNPLHQHHHPVTAIGIAIASGVFIISIIIIIRFMVINWLVVADIIIIVLDSLCPEPGPRRARSRSSSVQQVEWLAGRARRLKLILCLNFQYSLRSAAIVNRSIIMTVNITISITITDKDNASPRTSQSSPNFIIPGPVYHRRRRGKTIYTRDVENGSSR